MESKKVNIFALLLTLVMCVFSIYLGMRNTSKNGIDGDNGLSAYEIAKQNGFVGTEKEWLESLQFGEDGLTAYQVAVNNGFEGTEGEWLQSLDGEDGTNALAPVSVQDIYQAYIDLIGKTQAEYPFEQFLVYYYSVIPKNSAETATQLAYSSTVDICYTYSEYLYYVQSGTVGGLPAHKILPDSTRTYHGISAGAGVIYDMFDSNTDGKLDTAYIITNYHVAYLDGYCNDDDYVVYYDQNTGTYFTGTRYSDANLLTGVDKSSYPYSYYQYFMESTITIPENDDIIDTHFLDETKGEYYGIYLYGYQTADSKVNASFVGGSADNDIAVLKIEREDLSEEVAKLFFDSNYYVPAQIGDSSTIIGGEDVIAVGNPLIPETYSGMKIEQAEQAYIDALCLSSTNGIVSVVSCDCTFESIIDATQTVKMRLIRVSAAINAGNSGGGLYDMYGNLIGIVNSKIASSSYDNIGYVIPINTAVSIANQVISQCDGAVKISDNTRISILTSESLGFDAQNGKSNSKVITNANGNKEWFVDYNVIAKNVDEEGFAFTAGLKENDIIKSIQIDGETYEAGIDYRNYYDFERLLLSVDYNLSSVKLVVSRVVSGSLQDIEITFNLTSNLFVELK